MDELEDICREVVALIPDSNCVAAKQRKKTVIVCQSMRGSEIKRLKTLV